MRDVRAVLEEVMREQKAKLLKALEDETVLAMKALADEAGEAGDRGEDAGWRWLTENKKHPIPMEAETWVWEPAVKDEDYVGCPYRLPDMAFRAMMRGGDKPAIFKSKSEAFNEAARGVAWWLMMHGTG